MATFRLQPPAPFSFKSPDEWPKWKKSFEQFQAASGLNAEAGFALFSSQWARMQRILSFPQTQRQRKRKTMMS